MPDLSAALSSMGFLNAAGGANPLGLAMSATAQGIGSLTNLIGSIKDNKAAKRLEQDFVRPTFDIPDPITDNQAMLESEAAAGGLSDTARISYQNQSERDFSNALQAVLRAGAGPNNMSMLYDSQADNAEKLALLDEELRQKKLSNLAAQNNELAEWQTTEWQFNQQAPWADAMQKASELRNSGRQRSDKAVSLMGAGMNNIASAGTLQGERSPGSFSATPEATIMQQLMPGRGANANPQNLFRGFQLPVEWLNSGMTPEEIQMILNGYYGK